MAQLVCVCNERIFDDSSEDSMDTEFSSDSGDEAIERPTDDAETDEELSGDESSVEGEDTSDDEFYAADPMFVSKDSLIWSAAPVMPARHRNVNAIRMQPGITNIASSRLNTLKDTFLIFFPPHIEKVILQHTNAFGRLQNDNHIDVDAKFLHAYFAVLILAGVYRWVI